MLDNYHLLVESIPDYAIYMLDKQGHVQTWNVGAERSKGYSENEVLGKHFSIFFTEEDRQKDKPVKEMKAAVAQGRYEEEGWRVRKDGSRFWANVILTPLFSEKKEHIGFAKITRDLTEKRRNEELYLLLVNQVKEYALFMMDTGGHILTWNQGAERIKGYTAHDIIGKHFSVFYMKEEQDSGKPQNELQIAIRTGKYEEEGWRLRKDGSRFWASVVITPIYTDRHVGFAKVTRDMTEKMEMEKMTRANLVLEATNKELERFAYTVSHDLKEPLRKITMFADRMLASGEGDAGRQREQLNKIVSAARRMDTMIEDILDFSMLGNKQQFELRSLRETVLEVKDVLEGTIHDNKATVVCGDLPKVVMIPAQMRQLFQNLISNSIKFKKPGVPPEININFRYVDKDKVDHAGTWPSEQYLLVTLTDNGIGFDQQHAVRIFNLFDRLHPRKDYEGTGLGLAICKKIMENHGGIIYAQSEVGKGSEFSLLLPA